MDKDIKITDPDLLRELESARGNPAFPLVQRHLAETQRRRNEKAVKQSIMTPVQRRRDEMRDLIASTELKHEDRYHLHSVLALCALPYRRPPDGAIDFIREYGRSSLIVQAGYLKDPHTGKMVRQGLPAIRSFANSARKIDIILWLAYRLRNLERAYVIAWNNLRDQFGASVGRERKFKEDFREDLKAIKEVFPQLPAELTEKGLRLLPCTQETLFITPKKPLSSNN